MQESIYNNQYSSAVIELMCLCYKDAAVALLHFLSKLSDIGCLYEPIAHFVFSVMSASNVKYFNFDLNSVHFFWIEHKQNFKYSDFETRSGNKQQFLLTGNEHTKIHQKTIYLCLNVILITCC